MRKLVAALAAGVAIAFPTSAAAEVVATVPAEENASPAFVENYNRAWERSPETCREREHAVWKQGDPKSQVKEGADHMRRCRAQFMEARAAAQAAAAAAAQQLVSAPAPTAAPTSSAGGCPASMAPESGSAGYSAYNPSSGATGCYQIIPSTAEAHDCDLSTPAGQDECAARICATSGNGAWAASGAAPC
jgi:hypothetical protein